MKWGIVILLILGVVAAACAALLMGALSVRPSDAEGSESDKIEVAMAKEALPAITVITIDHINTEMISREELPPGQLVSPTQIIGRVLAMPVVEGQVLTESCFVPSGTAALLAAAIPHGMRAVTVSVSSRGMPDRALLYPGCVVDVLVSYKLSGNIEGEALSTTMLRGIQVLAISGDSVIKNPDSEEENGTTKRSTSRVALVTLLVDTEQAEALQLAIENGNIMLSIRNPRDKDDFDEDPSILNRGKLTPRGSDLPPAVLPHVNREPNLTQQGSDQSKQKSGSNNPQQGNTGNSVDGKKVPFPQPKPVDKSNNRRNPLREITVIRGTQKDVEEFDVP